MEALALTSLAIPQALDVLNQVLRSTSGADDLALPLRTLQGQGLSKLDLVVHIERIRAANDATGGNDELEENCLTALDIIHGKVPGLGLQWDAPHQAASLLPRALAALNVQAAMEPALHPSDLLPPRPVMTDAPDDVLNRLGRATLRAISTHEHLPARGDFVRAPKGPFTTRPAALLTLPDRIILEGLAGIVESRLEPLLPDGVVWPRVRFQDPTLEPGIQAIRSWESKYVVKADVSAFYESVEHSLLATCLVSYLQMPVHHARAIEAMLTSVMGIGRGLPQGPLASDVLASTYLLPLDLNFARSGTRFVRYADDYFLPASSMSEGRRLLNELEQRLGDFGLSLNASKTHVMRRHTYEKGLQRPSPAVVELREKLIASRINELYEIEDSDEVAEILEEAGVNEESLWDLFYHGTLTLDELIPNIIDELAPPLGQIYVALFGEIVKILRSEDKPPEGLGPTEQLARECLAYLVATDSDVDKADLRLVQTWFPGLTPIIVRYVSDRDSREHAWAVQYVADHLRSPSKMEWIDSWMCYCAKGVLRPSEMELIDLLRGVVSDASVGDLAKSAALQGLASVGRVGEEEWTGVFRAVSAALRSEMFFSALADLETYPWLLPHLREAPEPGFRLIAGELEQEERDTPDS